MSYCEKTYYAKWKLNGNRLSVIWPADDEDDEYIEDTKILSLTANELIVEFHFKDQDEEEYSKQYFKRIE